MPFAGMGYPDEPESPPELGAFYGTSGGDEPSPTSLRNAGPHVRCKKEESAVPTGTNLLLTSMTGANVPSAKPDSDRRNTMKPSTTDKMEGKMHKEEQIEIKNILLFGILIALVLAALSNCSSMPQTWRDYERSAAHKMIAIQENTGDVMKTGEGRK